MASVVAGCAREPCPEATTGPVVRLDRGLATCNERPVAKISGPVDIFLGQRVELAANASTDGNDDPLTFDWTLEGTPEGSDAKLETIARGVAFTVDRLGAYEVRLKASDGALDGEATWSLTAINHAPTADAGADRTAELDSRVTLDGTNSRDPEGDALTFAWTLELPVTSTAVLDDPTSSTPSFTADGDGLYVARLVVSDGELESAPVEVRIGVAIPGSAPIARAGPDQMVFAPGTVRLNGSASSDPDQDPLTYAWVVTASPMGASAVLSDSSSVAPTLTIDTTGRYVVQLVVDDGFRRSDPDTLVIDATRDVASQSTFDPDEVYLSGTLREGASYLDAIAHWSRPNQEVVGFVQLSDALVIRPSDGRLLYTLLGEGEYRLFEFHADDYELPEEEGDPPGYPSDPLANDVEIVAPCPKLSISYIVMRPDTSELLYRCNQDLVDASGDLVLALDASTQVLAVGPAGSFLLMDGLEVLVVTSTVTYRHVLDANRVVEGARIAGDRQGFHVVTSNPFETDDLRYYGLDGTFETLGTFPDVPEAIALRYRPKLSPDGEIFQIASSRETTQDVIVRRRIGLPTEIVYDEVTEPRVRIHISRLVTGP